MDKILGAGRNIFVGAFDNDLSRSVFAEDKRIKKIYPLKKRRNIMKTIRTLTVDFQV